MTDRRILQWDIKQDHNAYPEGPMARDKALYTFTGWEGCHRGSLLLTPVEAEFIRDSLTTEIEALRRENQELRQIVSDSAKALGNGAYIAPQCTIEFMKGLPREIGMHIAKSDIHREQLDRPRREAE